MIADTSQRFSALFVGRVLGAFGQKPGTTSSNRLSALFVGRVLGAGVSRPLFVCWLSFSALFVGRVLGAHGQATGDGREQREVSVPYSLGAFLGLGLSADLLPLFFGVSVPYSLGAFLGHGSAVIS